MVDRSAIGRRAKARGKADERRIGKILGLTRFPADTGGAIDLRGYGFAIQVKGGYTVTTSIMREALGQARAGTGTGEIPCVALVDRSGARIQEWLCFPAREFADFFGYGCDQESQECQPS